MSKAIVIRSNTDEKRYIVQFKLMAEELIEVGPTLEHQGWQNEYHVERAALRLAFETFAATPDAELRVIYRIGDQIINSGAETTLRNGILSIGCQTFGKTATRTLRKWAAKK